MITLVSVQLITIYLYSVFLQPQYKLISLIKMIKILTKQYTWRLCMHSDLKTLKKKKSWNVLFHTFIDFMKYCSGN